MIQKAEQIRLFYQDQPERCAPLVVRALKIQEQIRLVSPFIDLHTERICPACSTKCCINRHAYFTLDDLIYFSALGLTPEAQELHRSLNKEHCQFLTSSGCVLERHMRPLGCTWHFCDQLTVSMQHDAPDAYGKFSDEFDGLFLTWIWLTGSFRSVFREITRRELDEMPLGEVTHGLTFPWARVKKLPPP